MFVKHLVQVFHCQGTIFELVPTPEVSGEERIVKSNILTLECGFVCGRELVRIKHRNGPCPKARTHRKRQGKQEYSGGAIYGRAVQCGAFSLVKFLGAARQYEN